MFSFRYVIASPKFNPCSGGIRQLHYLAALLHSIGLTVAMTTRCHYCPTLPVVTQATPNDIAIYPDIYPGNRLNAHRVVRYMLGLLGNLYTKAGGGRIPEAELVLLGMASLRDQPARLLLEAQSVCDSELTEENLLFLPCVSEREWLYPDYKELAAVVYYGHQTCQQAPEIPGAIRIDERPGPDAWSQRMRTLALLRAAANFYTMDHFTVMEGEAALCGCQVYKVFGARDFRRQQPYLPGLLMDPQGDRELALRFHLTACRHFGCGSPC